jgi:aspartate aminotransferase
LQIRTILIERYFAYPSDREFHSRRDLVVGLLKEISGIKINVPEGAFYVFPDVSSFFGKTLKGTEIKDANDMAMYLLAEACVATVR